MDDKKKIVLGSEDFLSKGVDDIFININLQQTFNQIKKDKYDNNFDLAEQFRKERNESRSFRIYGLIDSNVTDTDNIDIRVFKDSGLTQFFGTITSTPLVYNEENVFAKKRGKYLLELDNYDSDYVYLQILGNNITYANQVFEQRLVFYDLDGEYVEYGTETVDIGLNNPGFQTINNDFPFFYNKHWIKKDIEIKEEKPTIMQFSRQASTLTEGDSLTVDIEMDKPSPFGNESVVLDINYTSALPADVNLSVNGTPVSFPIVLNWSPGEQNKTITFDALTDPVYEFSETFNLQLYNFAFTNSGLTTSHFVTITDATPRKFTNYHLGELYRNRLEFTGRTYTTGPTTNNTSSYAILRNGLKFDRKNEAFYPGDNYQLIVTNAGIDTILPVNTEFGVINEQSWPAGTDKTFNLNTTYSGSNYHSVKMIFPQGSPHNLGDFRVNGVDMGTNILSFPSMSNRVLDSSANDWLPSNGFEKDWSAVAEGTTAITFTSKVVGLPVDIDIVPTASSSPFPTPGQPPIPGATPILIDINPFVEDIPQIPKVLKLYANNATNTQTVYSFQFVKQGYDGIVVSANTQAASSTGVNRYLVTSFEKVCRNWNGSQYLPTLGDSCIYNTTPLPEFGGSFATEIGGIPNLGSPSAPNFLWPVGVAHINGTTFLSKNTLNPFNTEQNLSTFRTADFKPLPLLVKPCTISPTLLQGIAQKTKVTIPLVGSGNESMRQLLVANAESFRSFDFRTGTTGAFTTVYKSNPNFYTSSDMKWGNSVFLSGTTTATASMSQYLDFGGSGLPVGPVSGLDVNDNQLAINSPAFVFWLESKTPGVPFEITNIVNAYVHTTASNMFSQTVVAGQILGPITTEEIIPNGSIGDPSVSRNWMNGYNVEMQLGFPSSGGGGIGTTPSLPPAPLPPATF